MGVTESSEDLGVHCWQCAFANIHQTSHFELEVVYMKVFPLSNHPLWWAQGSRLYYLKTVLRNWIKCTLPKGDVVVCGSAQLFSLAGHQIWHSLLLRGNILPMAPHADVSDILFFTLWTHTPETTSLCLCKFSKWISILEAVLILISCLFVDNQFYYIFPLACLWDYTDYCWVHAFNFRQCFYFYFWD